MNSSTSGRFILLFGIITLVAAVLSAQDEGDIPIRAAVKIDAAAIEVTGRFKMAFEFTPEEDVGQALSIRVRLSQGDRRIIDRDHSPTPPTRTWKKGKTVSYVLDAALPPEGALEPDLEIVVSIGFLDAATKKRFVPLDAAGIDDGLAWMTSFKAPRALPIADEKAVDEAIKAGDALKSSGDAAGAWDAVEQALRRAATDPFKFKLRDALVRLGGFEPRPVSVVEQQIVERRISDEKQRYLRLFAGRLYDRKKYHGALLLLKELGGKLQEDADAAVIGALADAERVERDRQDIKTKLLDEIDDADRSEADADIKKLGADKQLLERAEAFTKKKRFPAARRLLRHLRFHDDQSVRDEAYRRLEALEKTMLEAIPPEQKAEVDGALNHPAWGRTTSVATHKFILIGPQELLRNIPADSRLRFDIAYVFLTDLFGRLPNPNGDRVTVYFKELWEFGGGVGGGTIIDIGNADPRSKSTRLDNGLLYHELTHCIDDTRPIYSGFREGLANFGAAFAAEMLGQKTDAWHSFEGNLAAFKKDYLERDLEYWRIQNYGPSAGFFLHFIEKYGKSSWGHDWSTYRRFFREYRKLPIRDGREPWLVRGLAYCLMRAFAPAAFDDLVTFRFPLVESDRDVIAVEIEEILAGVSPRNVLGYADVERLETCPNSPLVRDEIEGRLMGLMRGQGLEEAAKALSRGELGILHDWRVCGPFVSDGADPDAVVFPPEYELEFSKKYDTRSHIAEWRVPNEKPQVKIDAAGWVSFDFGYMNDTATYAVTHVTLPADVDGFGFVRADDDVTVFVNDVAVVKYEGGGGDSTWLWWRGPAAPMPDAMKFPVALKKGRNKVLLKIKNRAGPSGFVFALSDAAGKTIADLVADVETSPDARPALPKTSEWKRAVDIDFTSRGGGDAIAIAVGHFRARNKAFAGEMTNQGVGWRKYTVRPGFPKDAPSNLAWLKPNLTKGLESFAFELGLQDATPKMTVTFQGDGSDDGLSGWTLILHPIGQDSVGTRLERYDRLVYQTLPTKVITGRGPATLSLVLDQERLTVRLGEATLFDRVSIDMIPGRDRIGFATWGPEVAITSLRLLRPK